MRKQGRSALVVVGAVAVGAVIAGAIWLRADASATREEVLEEACREERACHRRAVALRDLASLNTADSRAALSDLSDATDEQLAAHACLTIGRADQSGGRAKLRGVFEDTKRPHGVRVAAFLAWAKREAKDGASWDSIESYAKQHYQTGSPLESSIQAAKSALFPATSGEGR